MWTDAVPLLRRPRMAWSKVFPVAGLGLVGVVFVLWASSSPTASLDADASAIVQHMHSRDQQFGSCVQQPSKHALRWGSDTSTADRICCHNRDFAEFAGYWRTTSFLTQYDEQAAKKREAAVHEATHVHPTLNLLPSMSPSLIAQVTFYDVASGRPLFRAPRGRSWQDFVAESMAHGWPSFRDEEVVWENVIVLPGGEAAAVDEPCPRPNPDRDPGLQAERETESGFENRAQVRPSR